MIEDSQFDRDTGELFGSTSDAAIAVSKARMEAEEAEVLGYDKSRLNAALMAAVSELPEWVTTDKKGAHNIKYATLKAILEKVRPALLKHGIRIRQGVERSFPLDEGHGVKGRLVIVYTDFVHTLSGQVERTIIEIPVIKMDAQAMGSAVKYGSRYTLLSGLGMTSDEADDDGESAKLNKITDEHKDSPLLSALTLEMKKIKDPSKLYEWGDDASSKRRFSQLDEGELAIMRQRFAEHGRSIVSTDEEPAPAKKGAKA